MTNTVPNVPRELKPCPFCGDTPELPSGDGTQYEIECSGCGQAMAGVQICDLMTLEERVADTFANYRYSEEFVERAKVEAIERWNTRAPSPAGVDGLEVVAWLSSETVDAVIPGAGYELLLIEGRNLEPLCRLSDAQAIIDGLREEVERSKRFAAGHVLTNERISAKLHTAEAERDQQAQRIGELEGLLLRVQVSLSLDDTEWGYSGAEKYKLLADIRTAILAGKDSDQ